MRGRPTAVSIRVQEIAPRPRTRDGVIPVRGREPVAIPVVEAIEPTPEAVEFVRFCYERSGVVWPDLYDEMCFVASRGTYKGLDYDELCAFGISFALPELPRLAAIAHRVVDEDRAARLLTVAPAV